MQAASPGGFAPETAGSAPLVQNYILTGQLTIQTTIIGPNRDIATVAVLSGSLVLWSQTLTQAMPTAKTTYPLSAGGTTIETGAEFTLAIPTQTQNGSVTMAATIDANGTRSQFGAQVANWPLTSSTSGA